MVLKHEVYLEVIANLQNQYLAEETEDSRF